jgi:hypothetical protein
MTTAKIAHLMALFLGISLLSNIGAAKAASPARTKTNAAKRTIANTPGGSLWKRNDTVGSNDSAYSINGTTQIDTKTGKSIKTGNVSPTMNGKPTGFWKGQDGNSYFNPKTSYVYYDNNDGLAKVALGESVLPKNTAPSTKSSSSSQLYSALGIKTTGGNSKTSTPAHAGYTNPSTKSSSSSKLYSALGIKTAGGNSKMNTTPQSGFTNPSNKSTSSSNASSQLYFGYMKGGQTGGGVSHSPYNY